MLLNFIFVKLVIIESTNHLLDINFSVVATYDDSVEIMTAPGYEYHIKDIRNTTDVALGSMDIKFDKGIFTVKYDANRLNFRFYNTVTIVIMNIKECKKYSEGYLLNLENGDVFYVVNCVAVKGNMVYARDNTLIVTNYTTKEY